MTIFKLTLVWIISLVIILVISYSLFKEDNNVVIPKENTPLPTSGPAPIPVYPNNGKE